MKLYTDTKAIDLCSGWYLLLDNDFLGEIYNDEDILHEYIGKFRESYLIIDPLTEFEFLRDVYAPEHRRLAETFISLPIFLPIANRQETYLKLQENAVLLSRIYSHKGFNKKTRISLVDLFLGARCMFNANSTMIVTGNKKDFPNIIFDVVTVINIEQNDGSMKPYSVIKFNKVKFDKCYKDMKTMEEKYDEKIKKTKKSESKEDDVVPF